MRASVFRQIAVRFLLAVCLAALVKWAGHWMAEVPVLSLLAHTSLLYVTASILFGWEGLVATLVAHVIYLYGWRAGISSFTALFAYVGSGALGWLVFRRVPRLSRCLDDLRSLGYFVAVAVTGGLLTPAVISFRSAESGELLSMIALWSRSTIVSVCVLGPPALILGVRYLGRWLAPIPGEPQPRPVRQILVTREVSATGEPWIAAAETREVSFERTSLAVLGFVVVLTAAKLVAVDGWEPTLVWWNLLYLAPVVWLAQRLWLRGGLVAAGFVGFVALAGDAYLAPSGNVSQQMALAVYAQLLLFWFVGALLGLSAGREGRLLEELAASHQRLREDLRRVVGALTGALEAKDEYTEGHLQRVNDYALVVARRLGLRGRDLELLQVAGTLHDMGKIAIPEAILNKPGKLSDEETAVMRRHPEIGARILEGIDGLQDAAPLVLHHHERWDGRTDGSHPGYPAGLSGDVIPLGSRIISVVDTFDAMTTDRPYRKAPGIERARAVLQEERAKQFDPRVVDCFLQVLVERPWDGEATSIGD